MADLATTKRFAPGSSIIRAGDRGDAFYVLLDGSPRSASVDAVTEVLTMRVGRSAFAKLLEQEAAIATALLVALANRVRRLERKGPD